MRAMSRRVGNRGEVLVDDFKFVEDGVQIGAGLVGLAQAEPLGRWAVRRLTHPVILVALSIVGRKRLRVKLVDPCGIRGRGLWRP
jgi:hypothetical protein